MNFNDYYSKSWKLSSENNKWKLLLNAFIYHYICINMPSEHYEANTFSSQKRIEWKKHVVCLYIHINENQMLLNRLNCTKQTLIIEKRYIWANTSTYLRDKHMFAIIRSHILLISQNWIRETCETPTHRFSYSSDSLFAKYAWKLKWIKKEHTQKLILYFPC